MTTTTMSRTTSLPSSADEPPVVDLDALRGSTTPRLWTTPLVTGRAGDCPCGCALTEDNSYGFDVIRFADKVLGEPLDGWQCWAVIHGGELLPDGRPRFRRVLLIVARQNGKTHLLKVLTLYWLFVERVKLVFGTSTNLGTATETWQEAADLALETPRLLRDMPGGKFHGISKGLARPTMRTNAGCRYQVGAANRKGGRGKAIDRLVCDELREHRSWESYNAAYRAMNARRYGQAWFITNQGDIEAIVLDSLRKQALAFIKEGIGDYRLGIFEWSAPDGSALNDPHALAMANPNLGYRIDAADLLNEASGIEPGTDEEAKWRTEVLCEKVSKFDAAVNARAWEDCAEKVDWAEHRKRVAMVIDASPDLLHISAVLAVELPDKRVALRVADDWSGPRAAEQMRAALPGLLSKVRPGVLGWMPGGPAAAFAADFKKLAGKTGATKVEEVKAEVPAMCMGLAEQVSSRNIVQPEDKLLTAQVTGTTKRFIGEVWVFTRKNEHCDAAYAAAGAVHIARTMPAPIGKPRLLVVQDDA